MHMYHLFHKDLDFFCEIKITKAIVKFIALHANAKKYLSYLCLLTNNDLTNVKTVPCPLH